MLLGIFDMLVCMNHVDCYRYIYAKQCKEKLGGEGISFGGLHAIILS